MSEPETTPKPATAKPEAQAAKQLVNPPPPQQIYLIEHAREQNYPGLELGPLPTEEEVKILLSDFDGDAYKEYTNKASLTDLKSGHLYERMHKAFGIGKVGYRDSKYTFPVKVGGKEFVIYEGAIEVYRCATEEEASVLRCNNMPCVAGGKVIRFAIPLSGAWPIGTPQDFNDAKKSAKTNAISKATFDVLGVATDMFKGHIKKVNGKFVVSKAEPAITNENQQQPMTKRESKEEKAERKTATSKDLLVAWALDLSKSSGPDAVKAAMKLWWDADPVPGIPMPLMRELSDAQIESLWARVKK